MADAVRPKLEAAKNELLKAEMHHSRLTKDLQKANSAQFSKF